MALTHRTYASQATLQLADLLKTEIQAERDIYAQKWQTEGEKPKGIAGYKLSTDRGEVKLTKTHEGETIAVTFNVTHSVAESDMDMDDMAEEYRAKQGEQHDDSQDGLSPATPEFTVEIEKNGRTLAFECNISSDHPADGQEDGEAQASFDIMEVFMYDGAKNLQDEQRYAVSGSVIDGAIYDHLMQYLNERGINSEFVHDLMNLASQHEHLQYMKLLRDMKDFIKK